MAQIENSVSVRKGRSFSNTKRLVTGIDMTPMVDLGFLLITFFVFTTTILKPSVTDLYMPKERGVPMPLPKSLALTVLLDDDNKIYYYHGDFSDAVRANEIFETSYSTYTGLGTIIRQKQKDIDAGGKFSDGRKGLMMLIKPTSQAVYKNVVDVLDEAVINDVKKYAVIEPAAAEIAFLKTRSGQ
jgi:biopolymer transport protein ExbD